MCPTDTLLYLEPGQIAFDLGWPGIVYETEVIPRGCPEADEVCKRALIAQPGTYEILVTIAAEATCGEGPCVCDGTSNPCLIDDPSAMLVDPQVVSATFDYPDDPEVVIELELQ